MKYEGDEDLHFFLLKECLYKNKKFSGAVLPAYWIVEHLNLVRQTLQVNRPVRQELALSWPANLQPLALCRVQELGGGAEVAGDPQVLLPVRPGVHGGHR